MPEATTATPTRDGPAQATDLLVDARDVVKTYRTGATEVHALRGVDLQVAAGEMVAIVGPSGSGKTTLLNCLSGLDDIDSGQVLIAGQDIHTMSERRRTSFRGQSMGFIFQAFNLVPVFSAAENVELPVLLNGGSPRQARARAEEMLSLVGLGERLDHRPRELSGGEQQRVAIARALASEPGIVWTDEPTGNLDSVTAARVMDVLSDLNDRGLTIVMVTHDDDVASRAARLLTMQDGTISGDDTTS